MYIEKEREIYESLEGNMAKNYHIEKLLLTIKDQVLASRIKNPQFSLVMEEQFMGSHE